MSTLPKSSVESQVYDLSLHGREPESTQAAWIERTEDGDEWICTTRIENGSPAEPIRLRAHAGHPGTPYAAGNRLLWNSFSDGQGRLCAAALPDTPGGMVSPVELPLPPNADGAAFAACEMPDNSLLILAEHRSVQASASSPREGNEAGKGVGGMSHTGLRLLRWRDTGIDDVCELPTRDAFCTRPRLCVTPTGAVAAWDTYVDGAYHVAIALLDHDGLDVTLEQLPVAPDTWDTLGALACDGAGRLYAARCRSRLVALDGEAANHHEELVVSVRPDAQTGWRDVAAVNIDEALNPWLAAYWGWRRYPRLIADEDGVWLLWEDKLDRDSMGPGPGRLCALKVTPAGAVGAPVILLSGLCMYGMAANATAPKLVVATKTQPQAFLFGLDYEVHTIELGKRDVEARPASEGNRARPLFSVRTQARARPVHDETGLRLFFGDPHVHSRLSYDLEGEPDVLYHVARDVADLDFAVLTENDGTRFTEPLTPADWEQSRRWADLFNEPGRFTTFVAWEYTLHTRPGHPESRNSHRSVIYPDRAAEIISWTDGAAPTAPDLVEQLRGTEVLLHHHHPSGFDITNDALERNIEITSGWFNAMRMPQFVENLHEQLDQGRRLGFIGGSDNHEHNPGLGGALTGVWAEANTREALFDAFRARRVYATTGPRPAIRFSVSGVDMGSQGRVTDAPVVALALRCDSESVERIRLIRDGVTVYDEAHDGHDVTLNWTDETCLPGNHWYYAHIRFKTDNTEADWAAPMALPWNIMPAYGIDAWTSPVWIER